MVASSVVSTILILNYHHRNSDTHEMSDWVSVFLTNLVKCTIYVKCWLYQEKHFSEIRIFCVNVIHVRDYRIFERHLLMVSCYIKKNIE